MVPRVQGPGVIDMQQAILKRLRSEIDRLKNERTEIIANSKQNQIVQNRIQAAVISIIQATTFEKMIHVVTHELPELLDVDFITLAIEANADAPKRVPVRGVYVLAPGAIDAAIGPDKHARLRASIAGEEAFFGDVARFVKSDVLMRLRVSSGSPDGVMCFGSRDPEAFGPEQATELLFFLAKVLENTIRAWLDLPEWPSVGLEAAREAWRDWLKSERRLAGHTLIAYEHDVAAFLGFMTTYLGAPPTLEALAKLKPAEFRAWLAERAHQGLARTSTARAFSSVRSFFHFLDKRGLAHNASIGAIQTPKLPRSVPKALSERDMEDLLGRAVRAGARRLARPARYRDPAAALRRRPAHRRGARPHQGHRRGAAEGGPRHAQRHRQGQQDAAGAAAAAGARGAEGLSRRLPLYGGARPEARRSSSAPAAARSIPPSCRSASATSAAASASPTA